MIYQNLHRMIFLNFIVHFPIMINSFWMFYQRYDLIHKIQTLSTSCLNGLTGSLIGLTVYPLCGWHHPKRPLFFDVAPEFML